MTEQTPPHSAEAIAHLLELDQRADQLRNEFVTACQAVEQQRRRIDLLWKAQGIEGITASKARRDHHCFFCHKLIDRGRLYAVFSITGRRERGHVKCVDDAKPPQKEGTTH